MKRADMNRQYVAPKKTNVFVVLAYLILGLYFLSFPFTLPFEIPEYVVNFNSWIVFVGGVLMLFGALNYFKAKRN